MQWNHKRSEVPAARAKSSIAPYRFRQKQGASTPSGTHIMAFQIRDQTDDYFHQISVITTNSPTGPKPIYQRFLQVSKTLGTPQTSTLTVDFYRGLWRDSQEDVLIDSRHREVKDILETIYATLQEGQVRPALMQLFRFVDSKLSEGDFQTCDELLASSHLEVFPPELLVGLLRITFPAHKKLTHWSITFEHVEERLLDLGHEPKQLLAGLPRE